MRTLVMTFLKGLTAVLPAALTVYLLWWTGTGAEALIGTGLQRVLPEGVYVPGMGLVVGVSIVFAIGVLMNAWIVRRIVRALEALVDRVPLVKTIYGSVKDLMALFRGGSGREGLQTVVSVEIAGARLVGLLTRESVEELAPAGGKGDEVAVYLPMSYQIGGFMVLVPRAALTPLDLSVEDALRLVVTAGVRHDDEPE